MKKSNRNTLIIVIILITIALWFYNKDRSGTISKELRDFAIEDSSYINKIFLANKAGEEVLLTKIKPGIWKVNEEFIARNDAINLLLATMLQIEFKAPVGKNAKENVTKNLASGACKVEIYENNELIKTYFVGGETQDQLGTYMLLVDPETGKNAPSACIVHIPGFNGYLTTRYFTQAKEWRSRNLFTFVPNEIQSVKVEFPLKRELSYEVKTLEKNVFDVVQLSSGNAIRDFDTLAVKQYLSYFQSVNFEDFASGLSPFQMDSIIQAIPIYELSITDFTGFSKKLRFYNKKGNPQEIDVDRMYANVDGDTELLVVQYYIFGKLLPTPDYFYKK